MLNRLKTILPTIILYCIVYTIRLGTLIGFGLSLFSLLIVSPPFNYLCAILFLSISITCIYAHFFEPQKIVIDHKSIDLNFSWPNQDKIKIAIISDLHLGPYNTGKFLEKVVQKINAQAPDLTLIAGDFYFYPNVKSLDQLTTPLKNLITPVFAVSGNHDYDNNQQYLLQLKSNLAKVNCRLIDNNQVDLKIKNTQLTIIGLSDFEKGTPNHKLITNNNLPSNTILLVHNPDQIHNLGTKKIPLTIAGHTHGGQIKIPFLYKKMIPTIHPFNCGLSQEKNTLLYITSGIGCSGLPLRFLRPPQIAILEIK